MGPSGGVVEGGLPATFRRAALAITYANYAAAASLRSRLS